MSSNQQIKELNKVLKSKRFKRKSKKDGASVENTLNIAWNDQIIVLLKGIVVEGIQAG